MLQPKLPEERRYALPAALLIVLFAQAAVVSALVISTLGPPGAALPDPKAKSREIAQAAFSLCLKNLRQATDGLDNDGDGEVDEGAGPGSDFLDPLSLLVLEGQLGRVGVAGWGPERDSNGNGRPDFGEPGVDGVPCWGGEMFCCAVFSQRDGRDNDSDGAADEEDEAGTVQIIAAGRFLGVVSEVLAAGELPDWEGGGADARPAEGTASGGGASPLLPARALCDGGAEVGAAAPGADRDLPAVGPFDFELGADGQVRDRGGLEIHDARRDGPFRGWSCGMDLWRFRAKDFGPGAAGLTFAVRGDAWIEGTGTSASVGADSDGGARVLEMTVIAAGEIRMTGNSRLRSGRSDGLLLASGRDIRILGHEGVDQSLQGSIVARGKVVLAGRPEVRGAIVARDALGAAGLRTAPAAVAARADPPARTPPPAGARRRFRLDPRIGSVEER